MKKFSLPILFFASIIMSSCLPLKSRDCDGLEENIGESVLLDCSLNQMEKATIKADAQRLSEMQFTPANSQGIIAQTFGQPNGLVFWKYIDERVNVIVSERVDLEDRIYQEPLRDGKTSDLSKNSRATTEVRNSPTANWFKAKKVVTAAVNPSLALWLTAILSEEPYVEFRSKTKSFSVSSSRVGVVQLGEGYMMEKTPGGRPISPITRISTLAHEARHSDCTGGLERNILSSIALDTSSGIEALQSQSSCAHAHSSCPEGHSLSGIPACDIRPWGAYGMEALISGAIYAKCSNCTEEEKQDSLISATDSMSRLVLTEDLKKAWNEEKASEELVKMFRGDFGAPDLSSSGIVDSSLGVIE